MYEESCIVFTELVYMKLDKLFHKIVLKQIILKSRKEEEFVEVCGSVVLILIQ